MTVPLLHAAATLCMTGLIWFVQVVHYPLFARVGESQFVEYERRHAERTTLVVAPLMITELVTAIWLWLNASDTAPGWLTSAGLILLAVIWISTALLQIPCHRRLSRGYDAAILRRLVRTNWIRTVAWSARSGVAIALLDNA